ARRRRMASPIPRSLTVIPFEFRMMLQPPPESLPPVNLWLLRPMVTSIGYATPSYAGGRLDFRLGRDGEGFRRVEFRAECKETASTALQIRWICGGTAREGGFLGVGTASGD